MPAPSVAIIVYPYMYATALASLFAKRGYAVTAPDIMSEEWEPVRRYDIVVTSLPVPWEGEHIHLDLPDDYADPVRISADGLTVEVTMDARRPVEHLLEFIDELVRSPVDATADALLEMTANG